MKSPCECDIEPPGSISYEVSSELLLLFINKIKTLIIIIIIIIIIIKSQRGNRKQEYDVQQIIRWFSKQLERSKEYYHNP